MKQFEKDKLKVLKEKTKLRDASDLFKHIFEHRDEMSDEDKNEFLTVLHEAFDDAGNILIERAILEKIITEEEYIKIKNKYNLEPTDFVSIFAPIFGKKDKRLKKKETIKVISMKYSSIFKCRKFIKKRFNVEILSAEEALSLVEKENAITNS